MATCRLEHSSGWNTRTVLIDGRPVGESAPQRKSATEAGRATVVFCTLGAVDRDGDIVEHGALVNHTAVVSRKEHGVIQRGEEPVGHAELEERGDQLLAHITFTDGASCRLMLDEKPDISMGYVAEGVRDPTPTERTKGAERIITRLRVVEISAVTKAAGIGTGVLGASCKCKGGCGCTSISEDDVRDLMTKAQRTVERATLILAAGAFRDRDQWARVDDERQEVARKALTFASQRLHLPQLSLKWRHLPGAWGHVRPDESNIVNLDPDLPLDAIPQVLFHEAQHVKDFADGRAPYEESAELVAGVLVRAWRAEHPDEA